MPLRGALTLANGKLFGGGSDGRLYAFDSKTGAALWSYKYAAPLNWQPVVSGSHLYVGSEDGNLLAFDESTGKLLWRFAPEGRFVDLSLMEATLSTLVPATAMSMR